jgi:hypothetical protein
MRKLAVFFAVALLLCIPLSANAMTYLGSGSLSVEASGPTGGVYYLDYDGTVTSSNFGYTTGLEEVFCVSSQSLVSPVNVDFYALTSGISAAMSQAAWIADNWTSWGTSDTIKGEAQKAIWAVLGVMNIMEGSGTDFTIFNASAAYSSYTTVNWYFADAANAQDFLTPSKVPIPAAVWLLGSGLLGLVGIRRRFTK